MRNLRPGRAFVLRGTPRRSYLAQRHLPADIFRTLFVSESKQHDILFSNAYAEFCRIEAAASCDLSEGPIVRELLFIDLFIVVALLGAEGGGGTCIFESNFHAFVSFMSNISWCFSSRHDYEVIFSFDFRFRLYLN